MFTENIWYFDECEINYVSGYIGNGSKDGAKNLLFVTSGNLDYRDRSIRM
jgi:hypothetical protein